MFKRYRAGITGLFLVMPLWLNLVAATMADGAGRMKSSTNLSLNISAPRSHEDIAGKNLEAAGADFRLAMVAIGSAGSSLIILLALITVLSLLGTWLLFHLLLRRRSMHTENELGHAMPLEVNARCELKTHNAHQEQRDLIPDKSVEGLRSVREGTSFSGSPACPSGDLDLAFRFLSTSSKHRWVKKLRQLRTANRRGRSSAALARRLNIGRGELELFLHLRQYQRHKHRRGDIL